MWKTTIAFDYVPIAHGTMPVNEEAAS